MKTTNEIYELREKEVSKPYKGESELDERLSKKWFSVSDVEKLQKELQKLIPNRYTGGIIERRDIDEVFNNFKGSD